MLSGNYRLPLPVGPLIAITFAHSYDRANTCEGIDKADKRQLLVKKRTHI
jgi:hypothetical protein